MFHYFFEFIEGSKFIKATNGLEQTGPLKFSVAFICILLITLEKFKTILMDSIKQISSYFASLSRRVLPSRGRN